MDKKVLFEAQAQKYDSISYRLKSIKLLQIWRKEFISQKRI